MLCFSAFPHSFFLPLSDVSSCSAALYSQHSGDGDETTAASEHHLQTHSLLQSIDKFKDISSPPPQMFVLLLLGKKVLPGTISNS